MPFDGLPRQDPYLPPGVTQRMLDDACGPDEEESYRRVSPDVGSSCADCHIVFTDEDIVYRHGDNPLLLLCEDCYQALLLLCEDCYQARRLMAT